MALAPGDLGAEGVEATLPVVAQVRQPAVDLFDAGEVDRVQAARAVGADRGEAVLPEDLEVLGHRRLGDAELGGDRVDHLAGGSSAAGEELEDSATHRVA